jgi:Nickel responsive protein SCO4226-like
MKGRVVMPKFVIERSLPGAGKLTAADLKGVAQKSTGVLEDMTANVQWLESYVTDNKIYCVFIAPDEAAVRKHAEVGEFPIDVVEQVRNVIDPSFAE